MFDVANLGSKDLYKYGEFLTSQSSLLRLLDKGYVDFGLKFYDSEERNSLLKQYDELSVEIETFILNHSYDYFHFDSKSRIAVDSFQELQNSVDGNFSYDFIEGYFEVFGLGKENIDKVEPEQFNHVDSVEPDIQRAVNFFQELQDSSEGNLSYDAIEGYFRGFGLGKVQKDSSCLFVEQILARRNLDYMNSLKSRFTSLRIGDSVYVYSRNCREEIHSFLSDFRVLIMSFGDLIEFDLGEYYIYE